MKVSSIRKFLATNKIFFEVIVASLLSFMAIYVSIQANRIAENQTRIMEQENMPQLEIRKSSDYNSLTNYYDNDNWYFFNRGGKLSDFDVEDFSFFDIFCLGEMYYDTLRLPLYSYFNMGGTLTGESEGLICKLDNNHINEFTGNLRDSLRNYGYCEINSFIMTSYIDIFDNKHSEYFQVNPIVKRISEKEWIRLKTIFQNVEDKFTLKTLRMNDIIKMIKNHNR